MPFPLIKLGYLAVRQISKPVVGQFKEFAKSSHVFRKFVCIPTAQLYHTFETRAKMVVMGLGKPQSVSPLNEQMAVELGAEILGEFIVFSIAAGLTIFEYNRNSIKSQAKEDELYDRVENLENACRRLAVLTDRQRAQISHLEREQHAIMQQQHNKWNLLKKNISQPNSSNQSSQFSKDSSKVITLERESILNEDKSRRKGEYSGITAWILDSNSSINNDQKYSTSPQLNIRPGPFFDKS